MTQHLDPRGNTPENDFQYDLWDDHGDDYDTDTEEDN